MLIFSRILILFYPLLTRSCAVAACLIFFPTVSIAQEAKEAIIPPGFAQCVLDLQEQARLAGISAGVIDGALANVRYLDKVIGYDRSQPEFVKTFPEYFSTRVTSKRIARGKELYEKHSAFLRELTQRYGVPGSYLVSFWGLETNFGSYKGKMPIIDSLTTLACDPRRSEFFSAELLQALRLMDREQIENAEMLGSWAGAMGHTQFMPSAYLSYAIDGDLDGKIDLWNSEKDALTSAANFLQQLGWKSGFKWGREVTLADNFDYKLAGKDRSQTVAFWAEHGVSKADGQALDKVAIKASLVIPAGHRGPAFLLYKNFDVILGWNNSEFYGIAVGHLADRINGKAPLSKALPDLPKYSLADIKLLQDSLNQLGFNVGEADGILGPATRVGVRDFQASENMIADGFPDQQVIDAVRRKIKPE
jgi:membrane-bound lytic murein transglycosylase B